MRNKKKEKEALSEDLAMEAVSEEDGGDIDIFGMERETIAQEEEKASKKKKKAAKGGFFKKMGEGLFGEDDEEDDATKK